MNRREFLLLSAANAAGLLVSKYIDPIKITGRAPNKETELPTAITYHEAPSLAELVAQGLLPPVDQRLPVNPLVITPINQIGSYGGRLRSISSWLGGQWEESQYGHSPMRLIDDGLGIAPGICDSWQTNETNTVWTFHLREGLKWSDGTPCTCSDILFWWEDLVLYLDGPDPVPDFGSAGGELATITQESDYTFTITYSYPSPLTAKKMALWVNGNIGPRFIAPKHYLSQFHPKYNPLIEDFSIFLEKVLFRQNPACPSLDPWICSQFTPSTETLPGSIRWVRNPYYYAVDPNGNQLPYLEGIDEQEVVNRVEQITKVKDGAVDFLSFGTFLLGDIPELIANELTGNFKVLFWDSGSGTGQVLFCNHDHPDEKKRTVFRNPKFKKALSHAINRPIIQDSIYANYGYQTTGTLSPKALEFNFNSEAQSRFVKYRDAYVEYNPNLSRSLLDEMGLIDVNGDGFREYPDGSPFVVHIDRPLDASDECKQVLDIVVPNWQKVGINVVIVDHDPGELRYFWESGQGDIRSNWEVGDGPDHLLYVSWVVPNEPERWAPLCGNLLAVKGTPLEFQDCDISPWDRVPPRFCASDPEYMGTPVETLHNIYEQAKIEVDSYQRILYVWDMLEIHYENVFYLGTVADFPRIIITGNNLRNVPTRDQLRLGGFVNPWIVPYPAITNPETYYLSSSADLSLVAPLVVESGATPFEPNHVSLIATVRNGSADPRNGIRVGFYDGNPDAGGVEIGIVEIDSIPAWEQKRAIYDWALNGNIENHVIYARLFPIDGITDPDPANNLLSVPLSVYYTDFRHDRDAYSFANSEVGAITNNDIFQYLADFDIPEIFWNPLLPFFGLLCEVNGHCYGMSNSCLVYLDYPELKPISGKSIYDHTLEEARGNIRTYQWYQIGSMFRILMGLETKDTQQQRQNTIDKIKQGEPVIHGLFNWSGIWPEKGSHAVVAHKVIDLGDSTKVYYYDCNFPLSAFSAENAETFGMFDNQGFSELVYPTLNPPIIFNKAFVISPQLSGADSARILWDFIQWTFASMFENQTFSIIVNGALNVSVFDSAGRETGYDSGEVLSEIPGSIVSDFDNSQSIILPTPDTYQINITLQPGALGTAKATLLQDGFSLTIFDPLSGVSARNIEFEAFDLSEGEIATVSYQPGQEQVNMILPGDIPLPPSTDQVVDSAKNIFLPFIQR